MDGDEPNFIMVPNPEKWLNFTSDALLYVKDKNTKEKVYEFTMKAGDPQTILFENRTSSLFASNKFQTEEEIKRKKGTNCIFPVNMSPFPRKLLKKKIVFKKQLSKKEQKEKLLKKREESLVFIYILLVFYLIFICLINKMFIKCY